MNGIGTGRPGFPRAWAVVALAALVTPAGSGCKMGTAGTKPSWWAFGGTPSSEAEKLAAAPSFSGGVDKPSASAKPYPTTSTPGSYVLDDATKGTAPAVAAATTTPAAVTYGATPPPTRPDPVALATSPAVADTSTPPLGSITPQVGPYAGLPAEPPTATAANSELPPLQAIAGDQRLTTPAFGATAQPEVGFAPPAASTPAPQRVADARGSSAWPAPPTAGGRYDGNAPSRFGSAAVDQPLPPPAAASVLPAALDPLPPAAVPSPAAPSSFPSPPAAVPAPAAPGGPVRRRADPDYRPGGTSSYRPSRAILAGDPPPAEPGAVRTVGFETPAGGTP
jgi:hypothetical protein